MTQRYTAAACSGMPSESASSVASGYYACHETDSSRTVSDNNMRHLSSRLNLPIRHKGFYERDTKCIPPPRLQRLLTVPGCNVYLQSHQEGRLFVDRLRVLHPVLLWEFRRRNASNATVIMVIVINQDHLCSKQNR